MPRQSPEQIAALYAVQGNMELLTPEEARVPVERRMRRLATLRAGSPPGSLYEIGAGRGEFLAHARSLGWTVAGIEPAASGVEQARARHGIELERGLFLPDHSCDSPHDVVCAWDVLEHCLDPDRILAAMIRCTRPGGLVAIAIPNVEGWPARLLGSRWRYRMAPKHIHFFTMRWLEETAARNDARIVDIRAFAKVHALVQAALPPSLAVRFRRAMPVRSTEPAQSRNPSAGSSRSQDRPAVTAQLRRGLRKAVLGFNQRPVPLPVSDLMDVTFERLR